MLVRVRKSVGGFVAGAFFSELARFGRLHPRAKPARHGVEVIRDVAYRGTGMKEHRLDVYRPAARSGPRPVVLYVHGGAFRILSKESHWLMGLIFARRGYVVFNINYRLAPRYRFPAAVEDCCEAFRWVAENAGRYGGDPRRLVLAGESAGANLATTLAIAACHRRPEPFARSVWDLGIVPGAVVPACGMLQVTDPERFRRNGRLPIWLYDRLEEVAEGYLPDTRSLGQEELDLADPLVFLERGNPPDRPLPPFFAPVGTKDPLLDDTRRLKKALDSLGAACEARYYEGEMHAFHALIWRKHALECWRDTFAFLDEHLGLVGARPTWSAAPRLGGGPLR